VTEYNEPGWHYFLNPPRAVGINDTIMDHKESKTTTFVREICQNSNDARLDSADKPVRIVFSKFSIPADLIPDIDSYKVAIDRCIESSKKFENDMTSLEAMNSVKCIVDSDSIPVMKVSDYNTTGLPGFGLDDDLKPWNRLTITNGISDKPVGGGGSKGVGKNSFYEVSSLRTLFFQTRLPDGRQCLVGRCSFVPFRDADGRKRDSVGFYSFDDMGYKPIQDPSLFPEFSTPRSETGSDVYIMGYEDTSEDWQTPIKITVVKGFFVAILDGKLEVEVDGCAISKDTIDKVVEDLLTKPGSDNDFDLKTLPLVIEAYRAGPIKDLPTDDFDLYLIKTEEQGRVITTKENSGMTINPRYRSRRCCGVVVARGEFAKLLSKTENPTHTEWNYNILSKADEKNFVRSKLNSMGQIVSNQIRAIDDSDTSTSVDAEGLGKYLGVRGDSGKGKPQPSVFGNVTISKPTSSKPSRSPVPYSTRDVPKIPKRVEPEDPDPEYEHKDKPVHGGSGTVLVPDDEGDPSTTKPVKFNLSDAKISGIRYISPSEGVYRVVFDSDKDCEIKFQLCVLYEGGIDSTRALPVISATDRQGTPVVCTGDTVGPLKVSCSGKNAVTVTTDYPLTCSVRMKVIR